MDSILLSMMNHSVFTDLTFESECAVADPRVGGGGGAKGTQAPPPPLPHLLYMLFLYKSSHAIAHFGVHQWL